MSDLKSQGGDLKSQGRASPGNSPRHVDSPSEKPDTIAIKLNEKDKPVNMENHTNPVHNPVAYDVTDSTQGGSNFFSKDDQNCFERCIAFGDDFAHETPEQTANRKIHEDTVMAREGKKKEAVYDLDHPVDVYHVYWTDDVTVPAAKRHKAPERHEPWTDLFYDLFMVAACNSIVKIFCQYTDYATNGPEDWQDSSSFFCAIGVWLAIYKLWDSVQYFLTILQSGHHPDKCHNLFYYYQMLCLLFVVIGMYYYTVQEVPCGCPTTTPAPSPSSGSSKGRRLFAAAASTSVDNCAYPYPAAPAGARRSDESSGRHLLAASSGYPCVVFASTTMDVGLMMGHAGLILAYLHAILVFWLDSKSIDPDTVKQAVKELEEEHFDEEAEQLSKLESIADMEDGDDKINKLCEAVLIVGAIVPVLKNAGESGLARKISRLIPQYGNQYSLYFLCGPIMSNLILLIAAIVHHTCIGNSQAQETAYCYIIAWGASTLWDIIITYSGVFTKQHDFSPGEDAFVPGADGEKHRSHCEGHHHHADVAEFFLRAKGHHQPPTHEHYRTARLAGLTVIVWGETILQLTQTGVSPVYGGNWQANTYLFFALFSAILFAKSYFEQHPAELEDHALASETPVRAILWSAIYTPFYLFATLAFGGSMEIVFAVLYQDSLPGGYILPSWKGRIVFGATGAIIILNTLLLSAHADSARLRRKYPLKWLGSQIGRYTIGVFALLCAWEFEPWKNGYASEAGNMWFLSIIVFAFAGGWYLYNSALYIIASLTIQADIDAYLHAARDASKALRVPIRDASKALRGPKKAQNTSAPPTMGGKGPTDAVLNDAL